jgi:hypothetical protein
MHRGGHREYGRINTGYRVSNLLLTRIPLPIPQIHYRRAGSKAAHPAAGYFLTCNTLAALRTMAGLTHSNAE